MDEIQYSPKSTGVKGQLIATSFNSRPPLEVENLGLRINQWLIDFGFPVYRIYTRSLVTRKESPIGEIWDVRSLTSARVSEWGSKQLGVKHRVACIPVRSGRDALRAYSPLGQRGPKKNGFPLSAAPSSFDNESLFRLTLIEIEEI